MAQRIFGLACGHADANDAARLADDPIHKMLLGRDPVLGESLGSQPTISRFENRVGRQELYAMGQELAASVIERHQQRLRGRARRITIDLDPTDDPTHGASPNNREGSGAGFSGSRPRCSASSPVRASVACTLTTDLNLSLREFVEDTPHTRAVSADLLRRTSPHWNSQEIRPTMHRWTVSG